MLFNILMSDIGDSLSSIMLHGYKLNRMLFADDLLLLSKSSSGLQKNICFVFVLIIV